MSANLGDRLREFEASAPRGAHDVRSLCREHDHPREATQLLAAVLQAPGGERNRDPSRTTTPAGGLRVIMLVLQSINSLLEGGAR